MARTLKAIKVKITIQNGKMSYPPFNEIPAAKRGDTDWSYYVDTGGISWHLSHDGFGEGVDPDSQYGLLAVPTDFADEALSRWPTLVTAMTESEVEEFWDNDAHSHEPFNLENLEVLQTMAAKRQMGMEPNVDDLAALDPDDSSPGIRKNHNKTWARYKAKKGITLL